MRCVIVVWGVVWREYDDEMRSSVCLVALLSAMVCMAADPIRLWPNGAPGGPEDIGPEKDTTTAKDGLVAGRRVIRLGNVAKPEITLYRPAKEKDTGAAIVVFPGGGYNILAMDLEGTEVCEWLQSIGVTGVLLKYRVPVRSGQLQTDCAALQDAQRAVGRSRAIARLSRGHPSEAHRGPGILSRRTLGCGAQHEFRRAYVSIHR